MVINHDHATFRAISDPTRRAILDLLSERDLMVKEITARFRVSQPAVSRHLRVLREARLVREQRVGRARVYGLDPEPLDVVREWLGRYPPLPNATAPTLRAWVDARSAGASARVTVAE
jgi:DNA-binding transcriptional ArsR family regulator